VLYPQNGDGIVTIDSVTSLYPMYSQKKSGYFFLPHGRPLVVGCVQYNSADYRRHIKPLFHLEPCLYGHRILSNAASGQPSPHQVAVPPRTVRLRAPHPLHRVQRICGRPTHAGAAQLPPRRTMRRTKVLAKPAVTFPAAAVSAPRCCRLKSATHGRWNA